MLKQLQRKLAKEKKDKSIFDIILYGSAVKGKSKPNDLDIAVVFRQGALRERLEKIQQIKRKIENGGKIDIKGILLEELFREEFFARSGLFLEGISVFSSRPFAEKIGFSAYSLFVYSLKDKTHSQKVQFNYLLRGRDKRGVLEMMEGKFVSPGAVIISPAHSVEFGEILQRNHIQHKKTDILVRF